MTIVKKNLKELRENKQLTQSEVAKKLNVSRQCYQHYESGLNEPSIKMIRNICKIFDCTSDELLGIT